MKNNITFISFFTEGFYEEVANEYLIPSLIKFNLPYCIYKRPNKKNWNLNTRYKAEVILEALETLGTDIVLIDVDATIEKEPTLFYNISKDLAVHYLDWELHWHGVSNQNVLQLATGTMYLRNNQKITDLVRNWIIEQEKTIDFLEQKVLENLLLHNKNIKVCNLPVEYCVIPKHDLTIPDYIGEPVILHHQISREVKKGGKL